MTIKPEETGLPKREQCIDGLSGQLGELEITQKVDAQVGSTSTANAESEVSELNSYESDVKENGCNQDSSTGQLHPVTDSEEKNPDPPAANEDKVSDIPDSDAQIFQLLDLLNEYEELANESLRLHYTNGFLELSRANYYGTQRFNTESMDMRPRDASTVIDCVSGGFAVIDRWQEHKTKLKAEKAAEKAAVSQKDSQGSEKAHTGDSKTEDKSDSDNDADEQRAISSARKDASELRNRSKKPNTKIPTTTEILSDETSEAAVTPPQDPVYQFGRLVPYQLRNAQTHFQNALRDSVKLLCLQQKITQLVAEIQGAC